MKFYLMSDDIVLRGRWMSAFSSVKPSTSSTLSLDIESDAIVLVSDTLLDGMSDDTARNLFARRVMVLSMTPNFSESQKFFLMGAMGYGNAMMHESHLHSAYQAMTEGKIWLHPDFISTMISQIQDKTQLQHKASNKILENLSHREREVALLLGEGNSHQQISEQLHITVRTVKAHATAIYQKLDVKDRLALSILLHS